MARRTRIGRIEVIAAIDYAPPPFEPQRFFPDVPLEAWEPYRNHHALDENGKFRTNFGVFVLRSDDFTVIVDTGLGPGPHGGVGGNEGKLLPNLDREGVRPTDITAVANTHLHGDHVGWNVVDEKPTFQNARYYVSQADWDYWTQEAVAANSPHVPASVLPLEKLNVLELVGGGYEIAPGVRTLATPGHTPGHQSFLIESDGQQGVVTGDVFHSRVQFTEPDWTAGFDVNKVQGRETRKALLERIVRDNLTVAASHLLIDTNIGQVVEIEGRRYWQPLAD